MAQAVIGPVSRWHDSGIVGVGPGLWYGPTALDGAAGDWKRAPLGSIYVQVDAAGTATSTWQKVAKAGATAEWKKIAAEDDAILRTTLDANTVLYATTDNTPAALAVGASQVVGRAATGNIVALDYSSNPGAAVKILATDTNGGITLTNGMEIRGTSNVLVDMFSGTDSGEAAGLRLRNTGETGMADVQYYSTATGKYLAIGTYAAGYMIFSSFSKMDFYCANALTLTLSEAGNVGVNKAIAGSKLAVVGLTDYANNAAALVGGLTAGDFFTETGTDPKRVCVVS